MNKHISKYDFAYGLFFICGLLILILGIVSIIPVDLNTAAALGFSVGIPLTMISLLLMVIAILYTVFLRRNKPLVGLSLITILFIIEMLGEYGPPFLYNVSPIIYGTVSITITILWFLVYRKRINKSV